MNTSTPQTWLAFGLTLVGALAVGYGLVKDHTDAEPVWVLVLAFVALAAWLARTLAGKFGLDRTDLTLSVVGAVTGGLAAAPTNGLAVVPAAVAVMIVIGRIERPALVGYGLAVATIALVAVGAVPFGTPVLGVLGMMGGVVLGAFAGVSRRQFRQAEAQAVLLRERELAVREERAQVELLGQRQEVARDIHDVLAHSLGGLVIQLDAVEALLEAGDVAAAQRRVEDARSLAADGLGEARRAVAALRDPNAAFGAAAGSAEAADIRDTAGAVVPSAFSATLDDLLAAHRSLGGVVDVTVTGDPVALDRASATALHRAAQEALSNVRKHAPGEPVRALLDWDNDRVRLTLSNPLADGAHPTLAASGGRHGLDGMRERFAALPLGGTATAGIVGDRFSVTVEARRARDAR